MGYHLVSPGLHCSSSILACISLLAESSIQVYQHIYHPLVHGQSIRRYQFRARHVFCHRLRRTVVAAEAPPALIRQVQLYPFRSSGWWNSSYGLHSHIRCLWWKWQVETFPVSRPSSPGPAFMCLYPLYELSLTCLLYRTWAGNPDPSLHNLDYCMVNSAVTS